MYNVLNNTIAVKDMEHTVLMNKNDFRLNGIGYGEALPHFRIAIKKKIIYSIRKAILIFNA